MEQELVDVDTLAQRLGQEVSLNNLLRKLL